MSNRIARIRTSAVAGATLVLVAGAASAQTAEPLTRPPRAAATSAAPVGETHRTGERAAAAVRDAEGRTTLRITIWYPAAEGSAAKPLLIGPPDAPLFEAGWAAPDAPFRADAPGTRRPVILLSHGFGGTARGVAWFGTAMAADGYVVIAVDHPGNNAMDPMTAAGAILSWERAEDLKHALDVVSRDPVLGGHIDLDRVGAAGFSAGGFTALVLGGARVEPDRLMRFCQANPDDGVCRPQVEAVVTEADRDSALARPDVASLLARAVDDHSLASVRAVFAMAPAIVQAIPPASLEAMDVPVWIVTGDADDVAPPATNARVAAAHIPGARLTLVPGAGHYVFLATCTGAGVAAIPVCRLAGAQEDAHRTAAAQGKELFGRYLTD